MSQQFSNAPKQFLLDLLVRGQDVVGPRGQVQDLSPLPLWAVALKPRRKQRGTQTTNT